MKKILIGTLLLLSVFLTACTDDPKPEDKDLFSENVVYYLKNDNQTNGKDANLLDLKASVPKGNGLIYWQFTLNLREQGDQEIENISFAVRSIGEMFVVITVQMIGDIDTKYISSVMRIDNETKLLKLDEKFFSEQNNLSSGEKYGALIIRFNYYTKENPENHIFGNAMEYYNIKKNGGIDPVDKIEVEGDGIEYGLSLYNLSYTGRKVS